MLLCIRLLLSQEFWVAVIKRHGVICYIYWGRIASLVSVVVVVVLLGFSEEFSKLAFHVICRLNAIFTTGSLNILCSNLVSNEVESWRDDTVLRTEVRAHSATYETLDEHS